MILDLNQYLPINIIFVHGPNRKDRIYLKLSELYTWSFKICHYSQMNAFDELKTRVGTVDQVVWLNIANRIIKTIN